MKQERKDKIIAYLEKKRSEGKLNMETVMNVLEQVERKAKEESAEYFEAALVGFKARVVRE